MKKFIAAGVLAVDAVAVAVGVAAAGPAHADPDSEFLDTVHSIESDGTFSWLKVRSDSDWIKVGKAMCNDLDRGSNTWDITVSLAKNPKAGFKMDQAGKFVAAAVESYCPAYAGGRTASR